MQREARDGAPHQRLGLLGPTLVEQHVGQRQMGLEAVGVEFDRPPHQSLGCFRRRPPAHQFDDGADIGEADGAQGEGGLDMADGLQRPVRSLRAMARARVIRTSARSGHSPSRCPNSASASAPAFLAQQGLGQEEPRLTETGLGFQRRPRRRLRTHMIAAQDQGAGPLLLAGRPRHSSK